MLRVHHLNCGSMCPYGGSFWDGESPLLGEGHLVCHCLLIETNEGLVLVDTGFGLDDIRDPHRRLSDFFLYVNNIQLREEDTAVRKIEALGFKREDVRHIVLTHLDFDHAGGLSDFPNARVHLLKAEYSAAMVARTLKDVARYRPQQWRNHKSWKRYAVGGEKWFGFDSVRSLEGLPPEILIVPLVGHTFGHSGIAVDMGHGWLLHAGDAYFYHQEMDLHVPRATMGLELYQTAMEVDRTMRIRNQKRLRELKRHHGHEVSIFCAHDQQELRQAQAGEYAWLNRPVDREAALVLPSQETPSTSL